MRGKDKTPEDCDRNRGPFEPSRGRRIGGSAGRRVVGERVTETSDGGRTTEANDGKHTERGHTERKHTEWKTHRAEEHTERAEEHTELKNTPSRRRVTEREGVGNRASELRGEQGTLLQALPEGLVATTGLIYDVV
jgi:hypothetical protein